MKPIQKYSTLFSLYIAQSVPMSFFSTVLPLIMRMNNFSMSGIAWIQLIKLPWILKFLWAPAIDKYGGTNIRYKKWIITSELFYAFCIVAIAFFNLNTDFHTIIMFMVLAIFFSATQDIASDALAIRILKKEERAFGNSVQSMGNFTGTLLGSGCLLIVYTYTGWTWLMIVLAAFVLLALVPILFSIRKRKEVTPNIEVQPISMRDIGTFFKIKGIGMWIIILALYYSGILGILSVLKPWFIDLGFEIKQIAFIVGIYGTACGACGAFIAGFIIKKLNVRNSLVLFSGFSVIAAAFFFYLCISGISLPLLYAAVALLWIAYAMSSVIIFTIAMDKVRPGKEATDYSIQIVITHLTGIILSIVAGKIVDTGGIKRLFAVETAVAVGVFCLVLFLPKVTRESNNTYKEDE